MDSLRRHPSAGGGDWPCVRRDAVRGGCIPAGRCKGRGRGRVCQAVLTGFLGVETRPFVAVVVSTPASRSRNSLTRRAREIGLGASTGLLEADLSCVLCGNLLPKTRPSITAQLESHVRRHTGGLALVASLASAAVAEFGPEWSLRMGSCASASAIRAKNRSSACCDFKTGRPVILQPVKNPIEMPRLTGE